VRLASAALLAIVPTTLAPAAPPTLLLPPPDASACALTTGKSDAPAMRTCASACCTRSVAMARSGLPASASSISDCSSVDPKAVHQVGETAAASADGASFHAPATGTSGFSCGLTIAQPERLDTSTRAMDRRSRVFIVSLRGKRHDRIEGRGLASW